MTRCAGLAGAIAGGLGLLACLNTKTAGTSSGTENPEMVLGFSRNGASARVEGTVEVFAADHNPILHSRPAAGFELKNTDAFTLSLRDMNNWNFTRGSSAPPAIGQVSFNVVFRSPSAVGVLGPFRLLGDTSLFLDDSRIEDPIDFPVESPDSLVGTLNTLTRVEPSYIYVAGTPFLSGIERGAYRLLGLPPGTYQGRIMNAEGEVFAVRDALVTGTPQSLRGGSQEGSVDLAASTIAVEVREWKLRDFLQPGRPEANDLCDLMLEPDRDFGLLITGDTLGLPDTAQILSWNTLVPELPTAIRFLVFHSLLREQKCIPFFSELAMDEICLTESIQTDPHVRLDSAYAVDAFERKVVARLYLEPPPPDTLVTLSVSRDKLDTVVVGRSPPDTGRVDLPREYQVWEWGLDEARGPDTIAIR